MKKLGTGIIFNQFLDINAPSKMFSPNVVIEVQCRQKWYLVMWSMFQGKIMPFMFL